MYTDRWDHPIGFWQSASGEHRILVVPGDPGTAVETDFKRCELDQFLAVLKQMTFCSGSKRLRTAVNDGSTRENRDGFFFESFPGST